LISWEENPRWYGNLEYPTRVSWEHFPEYVERKWVTDYFVENIWVFLLNRGKDSGQTEEETRKRYQVWASTPSYGSPMVVTINNFHASAELKKLLARESAERNQKEWASWRAKEQQQAAKEMAAKEEFRKKHPWLSFLTCY
jgi:hypothetical protein